MPDWPTWLPWEYPAWLWAARNLLLASPMYPSTWAAVVPPWGYSRWVIDCTETPGYWDWWTWRYCTVAAETPVATGTGSYGLYLSLLTLACTWVGVCPTRAATWATMAGFCEAATRERRISCSGTLPTSTVSLRSTISPRGGVTVTTRTWLRVACAA